MINPVKTHYDLHLGNFYSWMAGDLISKQNEFESFLIQQHLKPTSTRIAFDLGAGHGIQSIPLARIGYSVKAIDFNKQLLMELSQNTKGLNVEVMDADIRDFEKLSNHKPELIVCCGDTISHLDSWQDIADFISGMAQALTIVKGKLLLTFRDYTKELSGNERFIPVKSDESRILTCILEYGTHHVNVTDLLHEKTEEGWIQKISAYKKVRTSTNEIIKLLEQNHMNIQFNQVINGMTTVIAF